MSGVFKRDYYINLLFTLIVVTILFIVLNYKFIFGNFVYIFSSPNADYLSFYWPSHMYINQHYSITNFVFAYGLGGNPFNNKATLLDPFNILFLLGLNYNWTIIFQVFCRLLLIAIASYIAFGARNTTNFFYNAIFAVMFTYSGMFISWTLHDYNLTAIALCVLQWAGYELSKARNSKWYFIFLSIPVFSFASLYWTINFNIFLIIFMVLDNEFKNFKYFAQRILIAYIFIFLFTAWSTLPSAYTLSHNARVGGINILSLIKEVAHLNIYAQTILRGFGHYVLTYDKFLMSWCSGPLWYSNIPILVSAIAGGIYSKNKKAVLFITVITIGYIFVPITSLLFNGFSQVTMRWTWVILIPIYIMAIYFWTNIREVEPLKFSVYFLASIFTISALYLFITKDLSFENKYVVYTYTEIILIFIIILFALFILNINKIFILFVLLGLSDTFFQSYMFISNTIPLNNNYINNQYFYKNNTLSMTKYISLIEQSSFYRINKNYPEDTSGPFMLTLNENLIYNYYSVKQFISTQNPAYFKFNSDMGAKPFYNFVFGFDERYDILKMLGVKYILSQQESTVHGYSLIKKLDNIYLYKANNYKGIGYVFHQYVTTEDFLKLPVQQKDLVFSRCAILPSTFVSNRLQRLNPTDCLTKISVLDDTYETFNIDSINGHKISGNVHLNVAGILYLAIPYDQGFSAKVDAKYAEILNISDGFIGIELNQGFHHIELVYSPPFFKTGILISLISIVFCFIIFIILSVYKKICRVSAV